MRKLALSIVILVLVTSAAQAAVTTYPSSYHPIGTDYYQNLRMAKIAWLRANFAAVTSELKSDKANLASMNGKAAIDAKTTIDRLTVATSHLEAELKVMSGGRDAGQEAILKRNVQSWIGAARRGGNGAEAIRLMLDLQGTGL